MSDDISTKKWDHICSQNGNAKIYHNNSMGRQVPYFEFFDNWVLSFKFNLNNLSLLTFKYFLCLFLCCSTLQHRTGAMECVLGIIDGAAMGSEMSSHILLGFMPFCL